MEKIEKKIVWTFDEPGNHPPAHSSYLVFGKVIDRGKICDEARILYHSIGKGFEGADDMVITHWAVIPHPFKT